ncbi:MAG TPA: GAF domain-containing protein, partial [Phototrophicaceae bacterium]|nr:GAF domain-containing protein [Phototrophicaceae bacterium]
MTPSINRGRPSLRLTLLANSPWILAIMLGIVLFINLPTGNAIAVYIEPLILYGLLTAFVMFFGVILSQGELSPAHIVGIVAFLSLPLDATPAMTWGVFLGACAGVVLRMMANRDTRRPHVDKLPGAIMVVARVTLSFWAAGQIYIATGAPVPMGRLPYDITWLLLPLVIYALVYLTLYFSIFLLETYTEGSPIRQIVRNDLARIAVVLLLPVPFAVLSAEVINQLTTPSRVVLIAGLMLIVLALYALSLSEYRLRKQLDEQRTLSVVAQAMRSHLRLETLLKTIYVQIAELMSVDSFMVALINPDDQRLDFPFMIRRGQEIQKTSSSPDEYSQNLLGYVLKHEQPLLIEDQIEAKLAELHLQSEETGIESWMGVPLIASARVLGVMVVTSFDRKRKFNRDDYRLLNTVAANSSIAIE